MSKHQLIDQIEAAIIAGQKAHGADPSMIFVNPMGYVILHHEAHRIYDLNRAEPFVGFAVTVRGLPLMIFDVEETPAAGVEPRFVLGYAVHRVKF